MEHPSEAASEVALPDADASLQIGRLARLAATVQDRFGDLEQALLRKEDPISILSDLKAAWREFRNAAMNQ